MKKNRPFVDVVKPTWVTIPIKSDDLLITKRFWSVSPISNVAEDSVFATEIELPPAFFLNITLSPVRKGWFGK